MLEQKQSSPGRSARAGRPAFSLVELLVVLGILATLVALTLAAVQRVRGAAARASCQNNLKQIGLGLTHYSAAHGHFPRGHTPASGDYPYTGWAARLLPFVEQDALWRQAVEAYRQHPDPFHHTPPHPLDTVVRVYGCPSDSRVHAQQKARNTIPVGLSSYVGVSGRQTGWKDGMLFQDSQVRPADVTDGTSHTVVVGERPPSPDFWFGWWYGGYGINGSGFADQVLGTRDGSPQNDPFIPDCGDRPGGFKPGKIDSMCSAFHFWSLHPGGGHFAFADGSVHFLRYSANDLLPALATRAGGEAVTLPD